MGGGVAGRWQDLTVRYGFLDHTINFTIPDFDPLVNALQQTASGLVSFGLPDPGFADLTQLYRLRDGRLRYHSLGADWRVGRWNLMAERYELLPPGKQLDNRSRGWYLSIAREFNELTPYLVVGSYKAFMDRGMYA